MYIYMKYNDYKLGDKKLARYNYPGNHRSTGGGGVGIDYFNMATRGVAGGKTSEVRPLTA